LHQTRREFLGAALGRLQSGTGPATDTLLEVTRQGRRDSDRVRAATALIQHATHALAHGPSRYGAIEVASPARIDTEEVVALLTTQLRHVQASDLPTTDKAPLIVALTVALLRAIGVDAHDKQLAAVQAVLGARKDQER